MKKYLSILMLVVLVYFTAGGGCGKNAISANAMPIELYWFTVSDDITANIKNVSPVEGTAMHVDNFIFEFDVLIDAANPDMPVPDVAVVCLLDGVTVQEIRTPLVVGGKEYHLKIQLIGLNKGQKVNVNVDDVLNN